MKKPIAVILSLSLITALFLMATKTITPMVFWIVAALAALTAYLMSKIK